MIYNILQHIALDLWVSVNNFLWKRFWAAPAGSRREGFWSTLWSMW